MRRATRLQGPDGVSRCRGGQPQAAGAAELFGFFQLGRRFGLAPAPHVRGVGALVGLDVLEPPLAVAHGVKLSARGAAMDCSFNRHPYPPSISLRLVVLANPLKNESPFSSGIDI